MEKQNWIRYDIPKIEALQKTYQEVIEFILKELPSCNWNSPKAIVEFYKKEFDITLDNAKISTLSSILPNFEEDTLEFEVTLGLLYYLKLKYTIHNYTGAILRHEINGVVNLRYYEGEWCLPNRRAISRSPEIQQAIIATYQEGV